MWSSSELQFYLVLLKDSVDKFPVYHITEVLYIFGPSIAVVNVIGMLPDVHSQKREVVVGQRVACVRCIEDSHLILVLSQPSPARSKVGNCLGREVLEEVVKCSPLGKDKFFKFSVKLSLLWSDAIPVEGMIPVLGSIVENFLVFATK